MYIQKMYFIISILIFINIFSKVISRVKQLQIEKSEKNKMTIFTENLELFNTIMKKHNIFYWVGEGTALGFIRDKNFIKNDTDIDVGLWYKDKFKISMIHYEFVKNGFQIMRHVPFSLKRKGYYIDIDFTGLNKPAMAYDWPNISNNFINLIKPFNKIKINNIKYNVPNIKYIEFLYGSDYKKPLKDAKPKDYNIYNKKINMKLFYLKNIHHVLIRELLWLLN